MQKILGREEGEFQRREGGLGRKREKGKNQESWQSICPLGEGGRKGRRQDKEEEEQRRTFLTRGNQGGSDMPFSPLSSLQPSSSVSLVRTRLSLVWNWTFPKEKCKDLWIKNSSFLTLSLYLKDRKTRIMEKSVVQQSVGKFRVRKFLAGFRFSPPPPPSRGFALREDEDSWLGSWVH